MKAFEHTFPTGHTLPTPCAPWDNFKTFRNAVRHLGGVWASDDVYFSQMRDGYSASYKFAYPKPSNADMVIQTLIGTGAANRGNFELIAFNAGKFGSLYFDDLDDVPQEYRTHRNEKE